jgi:AcrR family transcriptional regulator
MNTVQKLSRGTRVGRDALRLQAIEAGGRILRKEGAKALNARRIAGEIGVAVGTLYNLFANFDEIVLHLNLETLEELERSFAGSALPKDPATATEILANTFLDFTAKHRHQWAAVLEFKTEHKLPIRAELRAVVARLASHVEQALAPLFPAGAEEERRLSAAVLWTSLEGIGALSAGGYSRLVAPASARDMAASLIANYVAGLTRRVPPGSVEGNR